MTTWGLRSLQFADRSPFRFLPAPLACYPRPERQRLMALGTAFVTVLAALVLQSTLLAGRLPFDVGFGLTLLVARRWGVGAGTLLGWWSGLLIGALRGGLAFPMALVYGVTGFLAGAYLDTAGPVRLLESAALVATASLLLAVGEAVVMLSQGLALNTAGALVLPTMLWQVVVLSPLLALLRRR